ncbi:F0F1 ATP synthase subunit B' [Fodinicurvata sp. EGI_FJ10296]|uniref:F0F1 ATP synthase subunit B family protein n=1 Tax=Fodinicurvata sp. EGI_FJ10296 TaxID=3231908 RepID=UPI0034542352
MPQFDPSSFISQLFWLAVTFVALYFLMSRIALPRIAEVLEERSERIADDLDRAENLRSEAETVITQYEAALTKARSEATSMIVGTQHDIDKTIEERTRDFDAQLGARLREAEERIGKAKSDALQQVRDIAVDITGDITTRLTGETPDSKAVAAAVDARMGGVPQ